MKIGRAPARIATDGRHRRRWLVPCSAFLAVLLGFMVLLLVGPPLSVQTAKAACVTSIKLPGPLRLLLNCNSSVFMRNSHRPARLLEAGTVYQTRPVFVLAGTLAGAIFYPFAQVLRPFVPEHPGATQHDPAKLTLGFKTLLPYFLGYVALNISMLVLTFALYWRSATGEVPLSGPVARIAFWVGTLLIFNDVVRAFIWSPHTQMFNLLLPALGVALIFPERRRSPTRLCLYALGIGVGILAYAASALLFPCLLIAEAWARRGTGWLAGGWRLLGLVAVMAMLCALPTALWFVFLHIAVGTIALPETSRGYNEVVWIVETLRMGVGAFVATAAGFLAFFIGQFLRQGIPAFIALGLALWLGRQQEKRPEAIRSAAFAAGVVALICIAFFTFIGWPAPRLGYPAVVAIIMLAGVVAVRVAGTLSGHLIRRAEFFFTTLAFAQAAYTLLKGGPLS